MATLVGRNAELGQVMQGLAAAAAGHARGFALVGEPGIGKTRLALEIADRAIEAGFAACWGRAWEAGGAPAYWPWRLLVDALPGGAAPIASLRGGTAISSTDPDQARFELFDAVATAIRTASARRPLLCILDDLHAADLPSLELAMFATRDLRASRIVWLVTWRDVEAQRAPVRDQLAKIAREATLLPLSRLSDGDANALIDGVRDDAPAELRATLVHATGGNPLFLLETLACLATQHTVPSDLDRLPLAQGVAAVVRERLAALSEPARERIQAAAIVGREVVLARWAAAADAAPELVRRGAAELVATGVLAPIDRDRWRFSHELVREAIVREASSERVAACHLRVAQALDRQVAAGELAAIGERAHHGLLALDDPRADVARVLGWTIEAADHARAQCAYEEALAVLERALARIDAARASSALLLALGRAHTDLGDLAAARDAFQAAIALARAASDAPTVARAVLGAGSRYVFGDIPDELIAAIDDAAAALDPAEHDLHARLLARKAAALTPARHPGEVLEMAREAWALVAGSCDAAARLEVAVAVGAAFADFAHPRERIPVNEAVVELARSCRDRALELRGLSRLVTDHMAAGNFARADALFATRQALARSLKQPRFAWQEQLFRSLRAMVDGDFARCEAALAAAEAIARPLADPTAARTLAVHRTWLLLAFDRVDALRAHEPALLDALRTMTSILRSVVRAAIRLRTGDHAAARREIDALEVGLPHGGAVVTLATLGEVVAEVGPVSLQRDIYDHLLPFADGYASWGPFGLTCGPPVSATLGMLAHVLGETAAATAHFEAALAMTTTAGVRIARVWTAYWAGRALGRADLLAEAERDATQLGMPDLAARCRRGAPAAARAPAAQPPAWSIREQAGAWLVERCARTFLVPNLRGMAMLARLAGQPNVEVHCLELVAGTAERDADPGDAGELLDDKARATYRRRIARLADDIEDATARGQVDRAEAARDEREALVKELARAVGLGGRARRAGVAAERARITAQRRIREAIRKIAEVDAELGAHLDGAIRTGGYCVYRP